jgi:hypothetical protein
MISPRELKLNPLSRIPCKTQVFRGMSWQGEVEIGGESSNIGILISLQHISTEVHEGLKVRIRQLWGDSESEGGEGLGAEVEDNGHSINRFNLLFPTFPKLKSQLICILQGQI